MSVKHDYFVSVAEEANSLVRHFDGAMVHCRHVFDRFFELLGREFDLGVGHLNRKKFLGLRIEFFLLTFEVFEAVRDVTAFDLLASEVIDFPCCFSDVFPAEMDQAQVFLKVLLFTIDPGLFDLQGV